MTNLLQTMNCHLDRRWPGWVRRLRGDVGSDGKGEGCGVGFGSASPTSRKKRDMGHPLVVGTGEGRRASRITVAHKVVIPTGAGRCCSIADRGACILEKEEKMAKIDHLGIVVKSIEQARSV